MNAGALLLMIAVKYTVVHTMIQSAVANILRVLFIWQYRLCSLPGIAIENARELEIPLAVAIAITWAGGYRA